ncbi:unnamed protein product [Effrenium voratum]|nr:unnamed protein product [Effrenium voratum]
MARNGVIGKQGRLPWSIPEDSKHFLSAVEGGTCISGRRSYEELGRAIPGAGLHIVLSKQQDLTYPDAMVRPNLGDAMMAALESGRPIWMCGGADVYQRTFPIAEEFWATHIDADVEGDVYFPDGWQDHFQHEASRHSSSDANFRYDFVVYRRTP